MPSLEIRRLTPPLAQDYLALFDAAFTDHPGWSSCYCLFYHSSEEPWREGPEVAADHRAARIEQLARGEVPGYLAYRDGRPVGWLNAGPRQAYQSLRRLPEGDPGDALVMCFVVLPEVRNPGGRLGPPRLRPVGPGLPGDDVGPGLPAGAHARGPVLGGRQLQGAALHVHRARVHDLRAGRSAGGAPAPVTAGPRRALPRGAAGPAAGASSFGHRRGPAECRREPRPCHIDPAW